MLMEVSAHAGFTVKPRFNYERFKEEKNEEHVMSYAIKNNMLCICVRAWSYEIARDKARKMMGKLFVSNGISNESGWNEETIPTIIE